MGGKVMISFKSLAFPREGFRRAESAGVLKQRFSAAFGIGWYLAV